MEEKVVKVSSLVDIAESESWEDIRDGAIVELPDGTKRRRLEFGSTEHDDAVKELEFKRRNNGVSISEAQDAQLEAKLRGAVEPYFDWHFDDTNHDVFERLDGAARYCLECGTASEVS